MKDQLIARLTESNGQKIQQLLTAKELGVRKPTQLVWKIQLLLGEKVKMIDSSLYRKLFLQCITANVQMILATADAMTINELAEMADQIMDVGMLIISSNRRPTEGGDIQSLILEDLAMALRTQSRLSP